MIPNSAKIHWKYWRMDTNVYSSFNLKEQLSLLLQNVYEVKQSTPALRSVFTMCDSTRQNGLVTVVLFWMQKQTNNSTPWTDLIVSLMSKFCTKLSNLAHCVGEGGVYFRGKAGRHNVAEIKNYCCDLVAIFGKAFSRIALKCKSLLLG